MKRAADPCGGKASTAAPHLSQWACVAPVLISAALARGCSTCNIYSEVLLAKAICHLCEQCSLDLCAICHCARRAWGALFRLCTHRSAERGATFSSAVKTKTCPVCLRRERTPICIVVQIEPFRPLIFFVVFILSGDWCARGFAHSPSVRTPSLQSSSCTYLICVSKSAHTLLHDLLQCFAPLGFLLNCFEPVLSATPLSCQPVQMREAHKRLGLLKTAPPSSVMHRSIAHQR